VAKLKSFSGTYEGSSQHSQTVNQSNASPHTQTWTSDARMLRPVLSIY
jgi:hypothetical protein